jgi:hypothetical protein
MSVRYCLFLRESDWLFEEVGFFTGLSEMPRKNPDKREAKRLEKLEIAKQSLGWRAAEMVKDGLSLRKAGGILGTSHRFVKNWIDRLLEKKHHWAYSESTCPCTKTPPNPPVSSRRMILMDPLT